MLYVDLTNTFQLVKKVHQEHLRTIITAFYTAALGEPDRRGIANQTRCDWWNGNLLGLG